MLPQCWATLWRNLSLHSLIMHLTSWDVAHACPTSTSALLTYISVQHFHHRHSKKDQHNKKTHTKSHLSLTHILCVWQRRNTFAWCRFFSFFFFPVHFFSFPMLDLYPLCPLLPHHHEFSAHILHNAYVQGRREFSCLRSAYFSSMLLCTCMKPGTLWMPLIFTCNAGSIHFKSPPFFI